MPLWVFLDLGGKSLANGANEGWAAVGDNERSAANDGSDKGIAVDGSKEGGANDGVAADNGAHEGLKMATKGCTANQARGKPRDFTTFGVATRSKTTDATRSLAQTVKGTEE